MKILHTSDWHLGHRLYGYDRSEEQQEMLRQMVQIVKEEKPDVFLIAGDIFHISQPSSEVQRMFTEAILDIRSAHRDMCIVITSGNHDSASRHEIFRTPWSLFNVHVIGKISEEIPDENIIFLPDKGYIVTVPYVNERSVPKGYIQNLLDIVGERNIDGLPVILTAHTTIRGADFRGHENVHSEEEDYHVGGIDGVRIEEFGKGYDYLALGHIHHAQFVHSGTDGDHHRVRYSGTPIPISFDEDYEHSVTLIEIEAHGAQIKDKQVIINTSRPLVTLPSGGNGTNWTTAIEMLKTYPKENKDYIRIIIEQDEPLLPGYQDEARKTLEGKNCRFCTIKYIEKNVAKRQVSKFSTEAFQAEDPFVIAKDFLEGKGYGFDDTLARMFREVYEIIKEEEREN